MTHSREYIERTIATVRNHADSDNSWPQWANVLADEIERLWDVEDENKALRMWLVTDGARARGLAESMTELSSFVRLEGVEENSAEIVRLLNIEERLNLPSASRDAA